MKRRSEDWREKCIAAYLHELKAALRAVLEEVLLHDDVQRGVGGGAGQRGCPVGPPHRAQRQAVKHVVPGRQACVWQGTVRLPSQALKDCSVAPHHELCLTMIFLSVAGKVCQVWRWLVFLKVCCS